VLGFACARSDTLASLGPFGPTRWLILHAIESDSDRARLRLRALRHPRFARALRSDSLADSSRHRVGLGSCSASPARAPTPSLRSGPSVRLAGWQILANPSSRWLRRGPARARAARRS